MPNDDYKVFGLIAVAVLALGLSFIVLRWPKTKHASFSQHVAVRKQSIVYYILLFAIVLPLLLLFFLYWFVPTFRLSIWFNIFVLASCLAQFACTLIPEIGGRWSTYHRLLAGLSGLLLIPASLLVVVSTDIDTLGRILAGVGLCAMLAVVSYASFYRGKPRFFLVLQSIYFTAFFLPILAISYL